MTVIRSYFLTNTKQKKCLFQRHNNKMRIFYFYLYIYPSDSQESDGGAIYRVSKGKQLPRPAFGDAKIVLPASNLVEILL